MEPGMIALSVFMSLGAVMALTAIGTHIWEARIVAMNKAAKKKEDEEQAAASRANARLKSPVPRVPVSKVSSTGSQEEKFTSVSLSPTTPSLFIGSPTSPSPVYSPSTPLTPYVSTGIFISAPRSDARPLLASPSPRVADSLTALPPRVKRYITPPAGLKIVPELRSVPVRESSLPFRQPVTTAGHGRVILARSVSELVGKPAPARLDRSETRQSNVIATDGNVQEVSRFGW